MTDIDQRADIDVILNGQAATVRIPLTGEPSLEWCQRYQGLARSRNLPARAEQTPQHTWLVIDLPAYTAPADAAGQLDAARDLIGAADAAAQTADAGQIERAARDWWAKQRG
ncbi:MAG TPA: hypothetical protein VGH27_21725 [Streptosporangiaceae bacterium]|jgi:hypothetical protein